MTIDDVLAFLSEQRDAARSKFEVMDAAFESSQDDKPSPSKIEVDAAWYQWHRVSEAMDLIRQYQEAQGDQ